MLTRILIVTLVLVIVSFFIKIRQTNNEWLVSTGEYVAKNDEQRILFEQKFDEWLKINNFYKSEQNPSWAGMHEINTEYTSYIGSYRGVESIYLDLRKTSRENIEVGYTQFNFYSRWNARGSDNEVRRIRKISENFIEDFVLFLETNE